MTNQHPPIDDEACDNGLDNEDASVDLNGGVLATGLDAAQTTTDANGSPCAIRLVNNDGGQPWAKYQITVDLAANDISPGDELEFSIDGNGSGGRARIEVVENARPNTWEIGHDFGNGWSTHTQRVTVPSGIATLDIWIYSNFNSSSAGSARYDNLSVRKTGQGTGGDDDEPDPPIDDEACDNGLDNEDASVDLNGGVLATGLDAAQTTTDANGSPCAIRLVNNDGGQPWAKYQITVDLAANDISPGDELEFSIDGNGSGGRARIEVVENARPNTWEIGHDFGNGWSTHTQRVTVPSGIATLDIWIYSNFNSSSAGSARYDNLSVRKVVDGTSLKTSLDLSGIAQNEELDTISVFPNPSTTEITVTLPLESELTAYAIYSINGMLIKNGTIDNNQRTLPIRVSDMVNGHYVLNLSNDQGKNEFLKIVKE
ncbi:T9SS type A sorting domain-containing protein [Maribacter halichondriae]|uniref:T9SS type A sorting domain-containing protein n=1 Tax=Maribacter halichondriae TaxID=2980554 RepID=UPI00235A2223|nr:T9SS type A sorting domain-containing protein [Maribacter sp. Hal144]